MLVRAAVDDRLGTVTTNDLSPAGLKRARVEAAEIAGSVAGQPFEHGFLASGAPIDAPSSFDEATAVIEPRERHAMLSGPIDRARRAGLLLAGNFQTGALETALWNSRGTTRYSRTTRAQMALTALDGLNPGDSTGYAADLEPVVRNLPVDELAESAVEKASAGRNPLDLEPDAYDVVLEPTAVAQLLEWMSYIGFAAMTVRDKTSFMADRLGEPITGERVTIVDDPLADGGIVVPFDSEGTPKVRRPLVEDGVAVNHVYDRKEGRRAGCASTGHAVGVGGGLSSGAIPTHLHFASGSDSADQLLGRVERGLWITRFHYVNGMLEPRRAVMTGLTRDGTFLIENGRRTRGIRNLRFTDSILEAFRRIDGISGACRTIPTWWSSLGALTAPSLLVRGFTFTGKTS